MSHVIILAGSVKEANVYARQAVLPRGRHIAPTSAAQITGVVPSEVHTLPGFRKRRDGHALMAAIKRASRRYQGVRFVDVDERGPLTERQLVVAHRYNDLVDAGIPENVDPVIAMATVEFTPEDLLAEQDEDDEEFCDDCAAGLESPEHHEKCVVPEREAAEAIAVIDEVVQIAQEAERLEGDDDTLPAINPEATVPVDIAGEALDSLDNSAASGTDAPDVKRRRRRCKDCGALHYKDEACIIDPDSLFGAE